MNGLKAVELVMEECLKNRKICCYNYKLILMDLDMPVMGGKEAFLILKKSMEDGIIPHVPIVAVSANPDAIEECLDCGMNGFYKKPVDYETFLELLKEYLG